jgi:ketosteroid isomerase-like protein
MFPGPSKSAGVHIVNRYLEAVSTQDWETAEGCLADGVMRVGPFGDTYTGRVEYLGYLRKLMPSLQGYRMDFTRLTVSSDGRVAVAQLTEAVEVDGRVVLTPESLVFDLDESGLIAEIRIYIQQNG